MITSNKPIVSLLLDALKAFGAEEVIISPGSRNAPLTIGFTNNSEFRCTSIIDERSAAFVAIGKYQATKKPVVVCCTSGAALIN